ncbi:CRISPR-associated helicase Cas3', partial [Desulfurobacterium sp.]|uniref:CRISPR-associated helicase Cas3' n=1 Tax=Desulfurobacterium sp. TaxID=2004706 RepID=UPI00261737AF
RLKQNDNDKLFLINSQFTYDDRKTNEQKIIKVVKNKNKKPIILVATQVIEISLDISCDVMYTELAPADALGQRGGRINRGKKNWKEDGKEYILKIFQPENELPYDRDILQHTDESLTPGVYSYLKLKEICNSVYGKNYIEVFEEKGRFLGYYSLINWSGYNGCFEKTCLFGLHPKDIAPDEETQIGLIIRPEKQRKFEVIPSVYYQGDERNLKIENKVKVPLWWILQDENEHGRDNLQWFEKIEKTNGRKRKIFWICKLPYNSEYGFDCSKIVEINQENFNEAII